MDMGDVFFRSPQKPKYEAINDINSEIDNMFRMVELFSDYLADMLKVQGWQPGEVQANAVTDAEAFRKQLKRRQSKVPDLKAFRQNSPSKFRRNLDF